MRGIIMKAYKTTKKLTNNGLKLMSMTSLSTLLVGCGFSFDDNFYHGTPDDDIMVGEGGAEYYVFYSSLGADKITGSASGAIMSKVVYSASNAAVKVNLDGTAGEGGHAEGDKLFYIDQIIGSDFDDVLTGDARNNQLYGGAGDDELIGGAGDDLLSGGVGADVLNGGAGKDYVNYSTSKAAVTVDLSGNISFGGDAQGDELISIENISASQYDDHLTGNGEDNTIYGSGGNDQIYGLDGNDSLDGSYGDAKIFGGNGNDVLRGGVGNDVLDGGAGDDKFYAETDVSVGANEISGGAGLDILYESKNDYIYESGRLVETVARKIEFVIQKSDNKIVFNHGQNTHILSSIEVIELSVRYETETLEIKDIKSIWGELAVVEQAKFTGEVDFLSWLGDDAGYNYEGL